jgi:hypothetical protein
MATRSLNRRVLACMPSLLPLLISAWLRCAMHFGCQRLGLRVHARLEVPLRLPGVRIVITRCLCEAVDAGNLGAELPPKRQSARGFAAAARGLHLCSADTRTPSH